jgi:hypothetical protein
MAALPDRSETAKWIPLSGIIFVVLTAVSVVGLGGSTPSSDDPAAKIRSFYDDHQARQFIGVFILAASVPFLVIFAAYLANKVADSDRRSLWQLMFLAGTAAVAVAWILTAFIHFALTDAVDQKQSDGALQALNALDNNTWIAFNSALGLMMLGAAGMLLTTAVTLGYRRLGWFALILGIALFIPFADFFALLLTGVWIIVASIMLARSAPVPALRGMTGAD